MKKFAALALGLSMMTMSVAPVFAQDVAEDATPTLISAVTTQNTTKIISLAGSNLDNIAKDLEMDASDVETILTRNEGYTTKPTERPELDTEYNPIIIVENEDGQAAMTLPIMTGDYQDVMTLPIMVGDYQDVMTLPAEISDANAVLRGTTQDGYQVAVVLPEDISEVDPTTLPAIVTDIAGSDLSEVAGNVDYTTLPAIIGDVDYTTLPAILGDVDYTTLPAIIGDVDYTTLPAIIGDVDYTTLPAELGNIDFTTLPATLGDADEYKLAVVTDTRVEKLAEASGKTVEYVESVLEPYTVQNLINADYVEVMPVTEEQ